MTDHIAVRGGGFYCRNTLGAKCAIDGARPMVQEADALI